MKKKKRIVAVCIVLFGSFLCSFWQKEYAWANEEKNLEINVEEYVQEEDFYELQTTVDHALGEKGIDFYEYVLGFVKGEKKLSVSQIVSDGEKLVKGQVEKNKSIWGRCFILALLSVFFSNLAMLFQNEMVGKTGAYIGFVWIVALLLVVFRDVFQETGQVLENIVLFMKALLPVYFMTITVSGGYETAATGYETALLGVVVTEMMIGRVFYNFIKMYFFLAMLNYIGFSNKLKQMLDFLENLVRWGMKAILGGMFGINVLQGMLGPAMDRMKENVIVKTGGAVPVVGDAFSGAAELALSVGCLLRNSVGVAGIIVLFVLTCAFVMKIVVYMIIFRVEAAVLQFVGGESIAECFVYVSKAAGLLCWICLASVLLFAVTIVVLSFSFGSVV